MAVRISDLAEQIIARQRVYAAAYAADLTRLRAQHGAAPKALQLIEQQAPPSHWDQRGHAARVRQGIERLMAERRDAEEPEPSHSSATNS